MDLRNLLGKLDQLNEGTMDSAKKKPTGPKFVGKMKGTDPASAAKDKYVGSSMEESIFKELEATLKKDPEKRDLMKEFREFKEAKAATASFRAGNAKRANLNAMSDEERRAYDKEQQEKQRKRDDARLERERQKLAAKKGAVKESSDIERKIHRTQQLIQDYYNRSRVTKNDIKRDHYIDMARQLEYELEGMINDANQAEQDGYDIAQHDATPSATWNRGGLEEGYIFKDKFPFDVDHMPGAVRRGGSVTTDIVKTKNKDKWDDMVDIINDEVFDDMADFRTNNEGETVTGNSAVWAKWDNRTQTGWINRKGQPLKPWPVKEQGLNEFAPGNGDDDDHYAEYVVYQCDPNDQFEFIGGPLYQSDNLGMAHKYAYEHFLRYRPKAFVVYQPHKEASRGNYGVKDERGVIEGEGDPDGLPHLTPELAGNIADQIDTEGSHAIVKSVEWGDGAAKELIEKIKDMLQDYASIVDETAAWRRKEGKNKNGGLNAKGVASYRRENPGSKLQTAVTTKPSKLKPGSKAAKRRKSFCARMGGMNGPMKDENGKPTRKALALRKWNCESAEHFGQMLDESFAQLDEIKQRLDPACWHNKKIGNPKTKMKGGVRVNNCVPKESTEHFSEFDWAVMEGGHELVKETTPPTPPGQQPAQQMQAAKPGQPTLGTNVAQQPQQAQQDQQQAKQQADAAKAAQQQKANLQKGVNTLKQAGAAISNADQTAKAFDKVDDNATLNAGDKTNLASAGTVLAPIMGNPQLAGKFKDLVTQAGVIQKQEQQKAQQQQAQQPQAPVGQVK